MLAAATRPTFHEIRCPAGNVLRALWSLFVLFAVRSRERTGSAVGSYH